MKIFDPVGFSSKLTGSFSGSFTGDGSSLTGTISSSIATTASYIKLSNVDGSASLASRIFTNSSSIGSLNAASGSYANSASFASDISTNSASIASLETVSGSYANSASFASDISTNSASIASLETVSGSYANSASFASSISANSSSIGSLNAVSSSYLLNTTDTLTGDLTVTGNIIATTLNVQDVTASVVYSSGSNIFGSSSIDTQQFTGSIKVSGSVDLQAGDAIFAGSVTANSLTVDDITIDGSTISDSSALTISSGDDITIDADSDINLDANGADIRFKDNGTAFVEFNSSTGTAFAGTISTVGASTFNLGEGVFTKAVNTSNAIASSNVWGYGLYEGASRIGEFSMVRDGSSSVYVGTSFAGQKLILGTAAKVTALTIDASQNSTFAGEVTLSTETQYLNFKKASTADILSTIVSETDAGTGGKLRFLTKRNGDTQVNALILDDNQNATFSGNVGIGATGLYSTDRALNLPGKGISFKNDVNGSNNNWSYIYNTDTGSASNLVFATGASLTALTLSHSGTATFAEDVEIRSGNKLILQRPNNGVATEISTDSTGAMILNSINVEGFFFNNAGTTAFKLDPTNATFVGNVTTGPTISLTSDNDTGYTNSRVILNATESTSRGAGIFCFNSADDIEWYSGLGYATNDFIISYKSTTSHTDETADQSLAKFKITTLGSATFNGTGGTTNVTVYDGSGNSEVGLKLQGDAATWTLQNWGSGGDKLRVLNNAGSSMQVWEDDGSVIFGGTDINGSYGASNTILAVQGSTSGGEGIIQITGKGNNATDNVGKIDFHSYSEADPMCSIRSIRGSADDQGELQLLTNSGGTIQERLTISKDGLVFINKDGFADGGLITGFRTAISVGQSAVAIGKVATYGGLAMVWMNYAGNIGYDLVSYSLSQVTVLSSQAISGGTSSRTYTSVSGVLKLTMGGSDTYSVYATEIRTANT